MKSSRLIIILAIIISSCNSDPKNPVQKTDPPKKDTSISIRKPFDLDSMEAIRERLMDTNYSFLDKLLDSCLKIADRRGFDKSYTATIDSGGFMFKKMYASISFGHLFSETRKHLLIKRFINEYEDYETNLYSDIFLLDNGSFKKVAADTSDNGYNRSYFEDVNHDGYKDYIVESYSPVGSAPRNDEMGYVYNPHSGHFETIDFFNRESDSLSNIFFETSYGRGDDINLYKYKWKGLKKILLEEIYVTRLQGVVVGPHPTSYTRIFYPGEKKQKIKKLPKEYARLQMAEYISKLED